MIVFILHRKHFSGSFVYAFDIGDGPIQIDYITAADANARGWWNPDFVIQ